MKSLLQNFLKSSLTCLVLVFNVCAQPSSAQVQSLIPSLYSLAVEARQANFSHPSLAAYEISWKVDQAIKELSAFVKGPQDAPRGIETLDKLTKELGPLKRIAHYDLHRTLAWLSADLGKTDEQAYHRAFGVALLMAFANTGDGKSPDTAYHIMSVREEYVWFEANRSTIQPISRVAKEINGTTHDVWTIRNPQNQQEGLLYFSAGKAMDSFSRVLLERADKKVVLPTTPTQ